MPTQCPWRDQEGTFFEPGLPSHAKNVSLEPLWNVPPQLLPNTLRREVSRTMRRMPLVQFHHFFFPFAVYKLKWGCAMLKHVAA